MEENKDIYVTGVTDSTEDNTNTNTSTFSSEQVFEELGRKYGGWTKWHIVVFTLLGTFTLMLNAMHTTAIVFLGLEPEVHYCALPEGVNKSTSIPCESGEGSTCVYSQCDVFTNYSNDYNTTQSCPNGWTYSDEVHSIVNQWDLVCDKAYLVETTKFLEVLGGLTVGTGLSVLADIYGRKYSFIINIVLSIFIGIANTFSTNLLVYMITRFVLASVQHVGINSGMLLLTEYFPARSREAAIILTELHWVVGLCALSLLAYVFPNWRHLMFLTTIPFIIIVLFVRFIPESPSWLVSKGRVKEAKQILIKVAKFNNQDIPKILLDDGGNTTEVADEDKHKVGKSDQSRKKEKKGEKREKAPDSDIRLLFTSRTLCLHLFVSMYIVFTLNLVYYGLVFNTAALPGDVYVNFVLGALAELPSVVVGIIALRYYGRRTISAVHFFLCAVALFGLLAITESGQKENLEEVEIFVYLVGKYANTVAFMVVVLYLNELFPTPLRSSAINISWVGGNIGQLVAPYTSVIVDIVPWLPQTVFAAMSLSAAIVIFLLPETDGATLPQTIQDIEDLKQKNKERKKKAKMEVGGEEIVTVDGQVLNSNKLEKL